MSQNTPTDNAWLSELLSKSLDQAMFDTANSNTREIDHFDIGREFNASNVKKELASRWANSVQATILTHIDTVCREARIDQMRKDMRWANSRLRLDLDVDTVIDELIAAQTPPLNPNKDTK